MLVFGNHFGCWVVFDFSKHFGLFHVDYHDPDKKRTPKESAYYYKYIVRNRKIE